MDFHIKNKKDVDNLLERIKQDFPNLLKTFDDFYVDIKVDPTPKEPKKTLKAQRNKDTTPTLTVDANDLSLAPVPSQEKARHLSCVETENEANYKMAFEIERPDFEVNDPLTEKIKHKFREFNKDLNELIIKARKKEIYRRTIIKMLESRLGVTLKDRYKATIEKLEHMCDKNRLLSEEKDEISNYFKRTDDISKLKQYKKDLSEERIL